MKLTQNDIARIRSWKEGQCCEQDTSRDSSIDHLLPMLPKVCFSIVARHAHKAKTTRGKLRRAIKAIELVLAVLDGKQGEA